MIWKEERPDFVHNQQNNSTQPGACRTQSSRNFGAPLLPSPHIERHVVCGY